MGRGCWLSCVVIITGWLVAVATYGLRGTRKSVCPRQALRTRKLLEFPLPTKRSLSIFSFWRNIGTDKSRDGPARDYLNGLVADSAARTRQQLSNIAFVKTHKTASTTLAYLLFRYARRHDIKLAHFDDHKSSIPLHEAVRQTHVAGGKGRCDIMHYHLSAFGQYTGTWKNAEVAYRKILRDPEKVNFITVMREPRSHLLSYYYYFIQPSTKKSIGEFLTSKNHAQDLFHKRLYNPLTAEFGVRTRRDLDYMITEGLPNMKLVLLTEQFDEGLMVLRRLLKWDMVDMTYLSMYKTVKGSKRYDGKELIDAPLFNDLPEHVQKLIDEKTRVDRKLYAAAQNEYRKRRDQVHRYLKADLAEFKKVQEVVETYLDNNQSSKANFMYKYADVYSEESPLYEF